MWFPHTLRWCCCFMMGRLQTVVSGRIWTPLLKFLPYKDVKNDRIKVDLARLTLIKASRFGNAVVNETSRLLLIFPAAVAWRRCSLVSVSWKCCCRTWRWSQAASTPSSWTPAAPPCRWTRQKGDSPSARTGLLTWEWTETGAIDWRTADVHLSFIVVIVLKRVLLIIVF